MKSAGPATVRTDGETPLGRADPGRRGRIEPTHRCGRTLAKGIRLLVPAIMVIAAWAAAGPTDVAGAATAQATSPIKHVVVILEENHSFDNVFGKYCTDVSAGQIVRAGVDDRCDGATEGVDKGTTIPLAAAPDMVPNSTHSVAAQVADMDHGAMDGFASTIPCNTKPDDCYNQYDPLSGPCTVGSCIPNISSLADQYAVSDRTFELISSPSWGGHLYFATASADGFLGDNPGTVSPTSGSGPVAYGGGWGCDSGATAQWYDVGTLVRVPSCVPNAAGSLGPNWTGYTGPHASYVPTIFDRLDAAGQSWRIYGGAGKSGGPDGFQTSGYQWTICPTFAECEYSTQRDDLVPESEFANDAKAGQLPAFSVVTPLQVDSQHNDTSMSTGDNYIGAMVKAVQAGSDWPSTAIFVTYDDCGCFYDHVDPQAYGSSWGVRVPLVIVSPYARSGYTDSNPTTFAGILAFTEHQLGLQPLNGADKSAYDFSSSFCLRPGVRGCISAGLGRSKLITQYVPPLTAAQAEAEKAAGRQDT